MIPLVHNDSGVCSGSPQTTARYSWNSSFPFPTLHTTLNCGGSSFSGTCGMGWSFSLKESMPCFPFSAVHCCAVCVPPLVSVAPCALPSTCWGNWKCWVKPHTDCLDFHPGRSWFHSLVPRVPKLLDPSSEQL